MDSVHGEYDCTQLAALELPRYNTLPSFGLYVDQLVSYVNATVGFSYISDEKPLTASMVNNYVKQGVVPKPEKKKYSRDHIAYLIVICILKKIFSIHEVTVLIQMQIEANSTEDSYDAFIDSLERNIVKIASSEKSNDRQEHTLCGEALLLDRAVLTFSNKLFVQMKIASKTSIDMYTEKSTKKAKKDKKNKTRD